MAYYTVKSSYFICIFLFYIVLTLTVLTFMFKSPTYDFIMTYIPGMDLFQSVHCGQFLCLHFHFLFLCCLV